MSEAATAARSAAVPENLSPETGSEVAPQAKILLVDDEPKSLFALQELLSTLGQNLMIAQSGEEALRLALKNDFAVILLDVRMPGIDGFETARLIRSRAHLTPIIFLTAAADEMASMFRGYEVGEQLAQRVEVLRLVVDQQDLRRRRRFGVAPDPEIGDRFDRPVHRAASSPAGGGPRSEPARRCSSGRACAGCASGRC